MSGAGALSCSDNSPLCGANKIYAGCCFELAIPQIRLNGGFSLCADRKMPHQAALSSLDCLR